MNLRLLGRTAAIAIFVVCARAPVFAQNRCELLFPPVRAEDPLSQQIRTATYENLRRGLDPVLLKKYHFELSKDGTDLIDKKPDGWPERLGKLSTLSTKYLFQWGPKEDHQAMLKDGGITESYMEDILQAPPQTIGKGFYVSTNPVDSARFGPSVTAFKQTRLIVILDFHQTDLFPLIKESTSLAKRLQAIGIDALRAFDYHENWLAVINSGVLQNATRLPAEIPKALAYSKDTMDALTNPLLQNANQVPEALLSKIPQDSLVMRILQNKPLSFDELLDFHKIATDPKIDDFARIRNGLPNAQQVARRATDFLATAKTATEAVLALKMIRDLNMTPAEELAFVGKPSLARFEDSQSPLAKQYEAVLDVYGVRSVALKAENKQVAEPLSLAKMKQAADQYRSVDDHEGFSYIQNLENFLQLGEKAYGLKEEFRGQSLLMTSSTKTDAQTMEVHPSVLKELRKNPVITLTATSEKPAIKGNSIVYIEYMTLERTQLFFAHLTPKLKSEINAWLKLGTPVDHTNPRVQETMLKATYEITKALLNPSEFQKKPIRGFRLQTPFDFYKLFVSVHPFKNGNGRMARLFYQHVSHAISHPIGKAKIGLALYDVDMFTDVNSIPQQARVGAAVKEWIRQAPNDQEFIQRARWAVELLFRVFPETRPLFPEFASLDGP